MQILATILIMALSFCMTSPSATYGGLPQVNLNNDGDVDGMENFLHVFEVGPGHDYADPGEVPWESLEPGTLVRIHYRKAPYRNKWVLAVTGTADAPIVVRGIPENGELPVITGKNATTRQILDYDDEGRSIIEIGGSNQPSGFPAYVTIENLVVRSARPTYTFTNASGSAQTYNQNASAIHVEEGAHITIRNCILRDCANGFFARPNSSDLLLESNYYVDNGIEGSYYQHNNYTQCMGITFQYNHFGPLRDGSLGNNLKDRSAGTLVRYNWIEAGNRNLDLVDSTDADLIEDADYRETFVYGNILIKHDVEKSSQILNYGGDSDNEDNYRKGTLWFFNNTVVSYRSGNTTLMHLSTNNEHAECFNNVVMAAADSGKLAILNAGGTINLHHNWLSEGWIDANRTLKGTITAQKNITGTEPEFADFDNKDYHLAAYSDCVDAGDNLPTDILPDHAHQYQYILHRSYTARTADSLIDMGAFELGDSSTDGAMACVVDHDTDKDVDGEDLALAARDVNNDCVSEFAQQFGW